MKKFYAFAAAAIATLSMNAQLYVVGNGTGLAWTPETPLTVEKAADGTYTFEVASLVEFKMSKTFGDWDAFNAGGLVANVSKDLLGTAVELSEGDANIGAPWKGSLLYTSPSPRD